MPINKVSDDIIYVGVNDHDIDLFEGQYCVPLGMSYNSYVVLDEKTAVLDSVSEGFGQEWLNNISEALNGRDVDYLVVHHMEPDHSSNIELLVKTYPNVQIVANKQAFAMMARYFGTDFEERQVPVREGNILDLGKHRLNFISAPFVHWPEVMVSYEESDKVLFSADAFGKFGALDKVDPEGWACEAARYYFGIVGMYGDFVQDLLGKISAFDIKTICPLHGPVLTDEIDECLNLYKLWSNYTPEREEVTIAYTSVYGNTKEAVLLLAGELEKLGEEVSIHDLARDDQAEAIEDAFRNDRLVLATTTYNSSIFPHMHTFIDTLVEHNFQKRTVALIENGSWAPVAAKEMREMLEPCYDLEFLDDVRIYGALNEASKEAIAALANDLHANDYSRTDREDLNLIEEKENGYRRYECSVCHWVYDEEKGIPAQGIAPGTRFEDLPDTFECPLCGVLKGMFKLME